MRYFKHLLTVLLIFLIINQNFSQTLEYKFDNEKGIGKKHCLSSSGNILVLVSDSKISIFQKRIEPLPFEPGTGSLMVDSMPFSFSWKNQLDWIELNSIEISEEVNVSNIIVDEINNFLIFADLGKVFQNPNSAKILTYKYSSNNVELVNEIILTDNSSGTFFGLNIDVSENNVMVVGSPYKGNGFVKIFQLEDTGNWVENLTYLGNSIDKFFGQSVNISNDSSTFSITRRDGDDINYVDIYKHDENKVFELVETLSDDEPKSDFGEYLDFSSNGNLISIGADEYLSNKKYSNFPFGDVSDQLGSVYSYSYDSINNKYSERGSVLRGNDLYDQFGSGIRLSSDGLRLFVVGVAQIYGGRGYINIYEFNGNWNIVSNMQMNNGYNGGYFGNEFDINSDGTIISGFTMDLSSNSSFEGSTTIYSFKNGDFDSSLEIDIEVYDKVSSDLVYSKIKVNGDVDGDYTNFVPKTVFSFDIDKTINNNNSFRWRIKESSRSEWSIYEDFDLYVVPPKIEVQSPKDDDILLSSQSIEFSWIDVLARSHFDIELFNNNDVSTPIYTEKIDKNNLEYTLDPGEYTFKVRSDYNGTVGLWSDEFTFIVNSDIDNDGIMDDEDNCPNTPSGESVDDNGCSDSQKDTDGDGITDDIDICPNTPTGETLDNNGCSDSQKDTDGDGITDDVDICPNTPTGETVDTDGCSDSQKDTDGDGIMDDVDICPNTPTGETVDTDGCSDSQKDTDGDGIMDDVDICPNTPNGETVDTDGCSDSQKDNDGDGIMDDVDICPNTPTGETVDNNGCFYLPLDNFNIQVISETCPDKKNGQIIISPSNKNYNYTVSIDGNQYNFNDIQTVLNLLPGTYDFCVSITGIDSFQQCYSVNIDEGVKVSGKSITTSNKTSIEITQGTSPYSIFINGKEQFKTSSPSFLVETTSGDLIEVKTSIECEGVFSKSIDLLDKMIVYPNPTNGDFKILLPVSQKEVSIELYTINSKLISVKTYPVLYGEIQLSIEDKPLGIYIIKVLLDTPVYLKIIKN